MHNTTHNSKQQTNNATRISIYMQYPIHYTPHTTNTLYPTHNQYTIPHTPPVHYTPHTTNTLYPTHNQYTIPHIPLIHYTSHTTNTLYSTHNFIHNPTQNPRHNPTHNPRYNPHTTNTQPTHIPTHIEKKWAESYEVMILKIKITIIQNNFLETALTFLILSDNKTVKRMYTNPYNLLLILKVDDQIHQIYNLLFLPVFYQHIRKVAPSYVYVARHECVHRMCQCNRACTHMCSPYPTKKHCTRKHLVWAEEDEDLMHEVCISHRIPRPWKKQRSSEEKK